MSGYDPPRPSGWALGGLIFAATVLLVVGVFQIVAGIAAIVDDEFYVVVANYAFDFDVTVWGWIHLVVGILAVLSGVALFGQRAWAAAVAVVVAVLSAISNFLFIPYYPFWSLLTIGLAIWVIWAVTRPGAVDDR
jgi:hypothetical protein